ncbi:MAG: cytochrome P450 [Polyangiales bacterium]
MAHIEAVPSEVRTIPGPRAWPLVGNLGMLQGLLRFTEVQWQAHGDVFAIHAGGMRGVVIADPELIQRVLITNRQNYVKGPVYDGARKILGDGLITLEGDAWRARRTLAQPAFHRQSLVRLTAIMAESGARFFDELARQIGDQPAELDAHRAMVRLTLDVVVHALFGKGLLDGDEVSYEALSQALEVISDAANGVPLPEWVPTPHNVKFRRTLRALNGNVHQIITRARQVGEQDGTLLSMLMSAREEDGSPLSDVAIRDEVITLFLAGHETTALTLTWMLVLLKSEPEVLARMVAEVDAVAPDRDPEFADIAKLEYVRRVIDETLRLRPAAPMVARNAVQDDVLGGYHVAKGAVVIPYIWGVHRHPAYWRDPLRFDPDRFLPGANKTRHPCSYLPFSSGPRSCIGNSFSLIEAVLLVAQLLRRFTVTIGPVEDVRPVAIGTVRPSSPVRMTLRRRAR